MMEQGQCCFATHEPPMLHSRIKGYVTEIVCFYLQEQKALEYQADFGLSKDEVRSLANGSFLAATAHAERASGEVF